MGHKNVVRIIDTIYCTKGCDWHPYGVAGCPYERDCNSIELKDRSVGTVATVCYIVDVRNSVVFFKERFYCIHIHDCL